eukprot:184779-Amphidinium_carterae.1
MSDAILQLIGVSAPLITSSMEGYKMLSYMIVLSTSNGGLLLYSPVKVNEEHTSSDLTCALSLASHTHTNKHQSHIRNYTQPAHLITLL